MEIIVGTAGHIDHGKTALVKALTGTDTDRLPEEKLRGITIDLGFAELQSDDVHIGFVDVPGHERFVKNMLAGASGIDLVLLVIAADEGVMPQTREHFDICRLLRIGGGVIVLTKSDLADPDTLELAKLETADLVKNALLENAPVFSVSSRTGEGITELRDALVRAAKGVQRGNDIHEARLPIDRSFSVKGFGAVVTGTLASGEIAEGEELELLPGGQKLRVRGIQTHGTATRVAQAGRRTAVNLAGISHDEITRGMTLSSPGALSVTQVFDGWVEVLPDSPRGLKSRQRVRVHLGTAEVLARIAVLNNAQTIQPGSDGHVQFRLESPVACTHGDRFIVRTYSPQRTIAGGSVLDPVAPRHRRSDLINVLPELRQLAEAVDRGEHPIEVFVRMARERGVRSSDLRSRMGLRSDVLGALIQTAKSKGEIVDANGVLVSKAMFDGLKLKALAAVEAHHRADKLARGVPRETLRERVFKHSDGDLFRAVTGTLERDGKIFFDQDVFKLASHETKLTPAETIARDELRTIYVNAGLAPPKLDDALSEASIKSGLDPKAARKVFQLLVNGGELISVTPEFYFRSDVVNSLTANIREMARVSGDAMIDVAKFKEIAGISRKYAIPLLEYFDHSRVTRRVGDKRQIL